MSKRLQKRALHSRLRKISSKLSRVNGNVIESLEPRFLLAGHPLRIISGHIFNDLNGNGTRQAKEHWLAGVAVYIDSNGNSVQDAGEPTAKTNKAGLFTFRKVPAGSYEIITIAPTGDAATKPSSGIASVNVTKRSVATLRFGFNAVPTPPVVTTPDTAAPSAALAAPVITSAGFDPYRFTVTWTDATAVDATTFGDGNIVVTGPNGYAEPAGLVALDATSNGSPRTATYQIPAPPAGWTVDADGTYTVSLNGGQIRDTLGNTDAAIDLGTFSAVVPSGIIGSPALIGGINNITTLNNATPATKLSFNISNTVAGAQLGLEADGIPLASAPASAGSTIISTNGNSLLSDGQHQFSVTQTLANGMESTSTPQNIVIDTLGPTDALHATPITVAGGSTYTFTVTYTDATAISNATLAGNALLVTAPNTQHLTPTLVSLDANTDGPTRTATYSIAAPGGSWTGTSNGTFTVTLLPNSVFDEVHNAATGRVMGTFTVSIGQALSPITGTPTLLPASDTGSYSNDGVTDLNNSSHGKSLQISVPGTQSGATVTIFSDGTPIGSATAAGSTTIVTTNGTTALANGTHLLTAAQTVTGQGASDASGPLGIVVDTLAPTATASPAPVSGFGATNYTFAVVYRDDIAVDASHLGTGDVDVTGPNFFSQIATLISLNSSSSGSPRTATYAITPPGGSWQASANGTYTIAKQAGQIFDTAGNVAAAGPVATFVVHAGVPVSPIPGAPALLAASDGGISAGDDITNGNNGSPGATLQFDVPGTTAGATVTLYSDGTPIGAAVAGGTSVVVTTNGTAIIGDGPHVITARQTLPGDGQSSDSAGISIVVDSAPPTIASLSAPTVISAGATNYTFTVTYADATGVDVSLLGSGDLKVTTPANATLPVTFVSASPNADAKSITATYQLTPPNGTWDASDVGTYTITLQTGQIHDIAGNTAAPKNIGTFSVNIAAPATATPAAPALAAISDTGPNAADGLTNLNNASSAGELQFNVGSTISGATVTVYADGSPIGATVATGATTVVTSNGTLALGNGQHSITAVQTSPGSSPSPASSSTAITVDTIAPTAGSLSAANVTANGASTYTFTVVYADATSIDFSSLSNNDIIVNSPGNIAIPATFLSSSPSVNSTSITATYQITPPGGTWGSTDNGKYTVATQGNQVRDIAGNFVAAGSPGFFNVNIATPVTATPGRPDLLSATDTGTSAADSITSLNNSASGSTLQFSVANTVAGATVTVYSDGTPIGATVATGTSTTVTTTGNTPIADGPHAITARQQSPGAPQSAASTGLTITIDTTPPAAAATLSDVTTPGGSTYSFTVTYTDAVAVDASTIGNNNLVITGPNAFNANAAVVSIDNAADGSPRTAIYQISAPVGGWTINDDGVYTVTLNAGQILDTAGNAIALKMLGTFNVAI